MFKDYYSILDLSYPSNNEEIKQAYQSKVQCLGKESSLISSPNYQQRFDVEEAFRVIGSSYSLKKAYDEEYPKYLESIEKDSFSIQDDWTLSLINSERNFVANYLSHLMQTNQVKKTNWGGKTLGCLGTLMGLFFLVLFVTGVRTCTRKHAQNVFSRSVDNSDNVVKPSSFSNSICNQLYTSKSNAERKIQNMAREINQDLPQKIDDNITHTAITLSSTALVYEYEVDDVFFEMNKDLALSLNRQCNNIRAMYSDMKPMIDLLLETNRGISYKYVCKISGETYIVEVPYSKLANL